MDTNFILNSLCNLILDYSNLFVKKKMHDLVNGHSFGIDFKIGD